MLSQELRRRFVEFFYENKHEIVPSSSLIPNNDPTLLFTNAGMVQFKDVFLGIDARPYSRAASVQRCLRAGGKHNDLENVGHTKRHHTFFEMLGNFSFADYFKVEAIQYAWHFLTKILQIPPERLWVTVFKDDQESEEIWLKQIKVNPDRVIRCGEKDNFWSMGEVGPCGPCSEIFYDHGASVAGGPPGSAEQDGDRYVEVWNLVFMQYNRDAEGKLHLLPQPCVDTGMGLERISAVMQGVHDNYDTDLFVPLLQALANIVHDNNFKSPSMRVIVDHIRSVSFLILDGVIPSNEGRGYVLRRIIRRAIRHGYKLGQHQAFFYQLVDPLVENMAESNPELKQAADHIKKVIQHEELQFASTLENGLRIFEQAISQLSTTVIPGEVVFQLYDTYGFPVDLTADMAVEKGLTLDEAGFQTAMAEQRFKSQQAHQFKAKSLTLLQVEGETLFTGYNKHSDDAVVKFLFKANQAINQLSADEEGIIILDKTPFYAESGGQVGDRGIIFTTQGHFKVLDTQKQGKVYLHIGKMLSGELILGDMVQAVVDESRQAIMANHSATHLLHAALRQILGSHVVQKGSLVAVDRLRFDFAHPKPLTSEEIASLEALVNYQIRTNPESDVVETSLEDAKQTGAMALFGEKYGDQVRVVTMGQFSTEICGGTHVHALGEIGLFKIMSENAVAAGIRRIEAVTGQQALEWVQANEAKLHHLQAILKASRDDVVEKLEQILQDQRETNRQVESLKQQFAKQQIQQLLNEVVVISGVHILVAKLEVDRETLRHSMDQLRSQLSPSVIVLASIIDQKVQLMVAVSKDCLKYFKAPQLLSHLMQQVDGRGGGRDELAQGAGENCAALPMALSSVVDWIKNQINH